LWISGSGNPSFRRWKRAPIRLRQTPTTYRAAGAPPPAPSDWPYVTRGSQSQNLPGTSISASKPTFASEGSGLISCSSMKPDSSAFEQSTDGPWAPDDACGIFGVAHIIPPARMKARLRSKMHNWRTTIRLAFTFDEEDSTRQIGEFATRRARAFAHDVGALAGETDRELQAAEKTTGLNICNRSQRKKSFIALLPCRSHFAPGRSDSGDRKVGRRARRRRTRRNVASTKACGVSGVKTAIWSSREFRRVRFSSNQRCETKGPARSRGTTPLRRAFDVYSPHRDEDAPV